MTFRDISISWKLTLLAVATTLFSMLAVIWTTAIIDRQLSKMSMVENYETIANVLGQNCLHSIESADHSGADQALSAIRMDYQVVLASLYNLDGQTCATVQRGQIDSPSLDVAQQLNGTFSDGFLHITRPIQRSNSTLGYVYLRISIDKLTARWWDQFMVAASTFCLSLLIAVAFAGRMQRFISGPVLHLVDTAHHVTTSRDFSIRAEKETGDELGVLVDQFNEMLATIETRDVELESHQQNLEVLVSKRTLELETKTKEAMESSVAKSVFLANMSHEIRTPMNAIIGFANLLRQGNYADQNEQKEFLNIICSSGEHLLGLISDILDLSKIEAGCMTTECLPVSPHQLISDVISITRVNAHTKGLGLDYTWIGSVPNQIQTDPAKFRQLLINLIGNAIKFTEHGCVQVIARLRTEQQSLEVQVIDSGIGIPLDKQEAIFTPFSQADASMTRRFGGTGLGLSISRKIAEALGGTLLVESAPGVGSTFTATIATGELDAVEFFPTAPVSDVIPHLDHAAGDPIKSVPRGGRILLVEDGDSNRRLIHAMLQRHGLEVTDAVNGQVGVDLATTHEFDAILMDMQMPVKDGYTAARELRAKGLAIPIVALTAHAMSGDAERCHQAGCSDYLTKPIQEARLLSKLSELLNRSFTGKSGQSVESPATLDHESAIEYGFLEPAELMTATKVRVICALPLDDDVFREIVHEFSGKLRTQVECMKLAYSAEHWNDLIELAHWLKGSGGTAGYEQFTIPSSRLERMAKQRNHEKIGQILQEIDLLTIAVAEDLASLPLYV